MVGLAAGHLHLLWYKREEGGRERKREKYGGGGAIN